jgi:two-component system, cell cycle sensor histidine kinase and response regulator CckA
MTVPLRALIVEDSEDDTVLLVRELRRGGYEVTFERVDSPQALDVAISTREWDIVICDYSMPHFSGTDALRLLRTKGSEVPFIFLSGTIGEETAVAALKEGAQDYLMKGNLKRLIPAIQREIREQEERWHRKRLEQQVQWLQKFETIGRLAGGIAHDFNNALGVILGWSELGDQRAETGSRQQLREAFRKISDAAQRSAGLTAQLLSFARRQVLQPRNVNLNNLVSETTSLLESVVGPRIEFKVALAQDLKSIHADPTQIHQLLMNLCLNARDAMPRGGQLLVETQNTEIQEDFCKTYPYAQPGNYVLLSVSDTGVGMDAETLDHIFEPFFTTKEFGRGTGLGLASVYGIVKQHDGFLNVFSERGHGSTFHVYFPAASAEAQDVQKVPTADRAQGGPETILVAEDDHALHEMVLRSLETLGYRVIAVSNGAEAVQEFTANRDEIRLVILDIVMPVLDGKEAYLQMREVRPDIPVVFTSGHTTESVLLSSQVKAGAVFLQKPYSISDLGRVVRDVLDRAQSN